MSAEKQNPMENSFQKHVENSIKMFQDTASSVAKAYENQLDFATKLYNNALDNTMNIKPGAMISPVRISEILNEIMQKSLESLSQISKSSFETIQQFGNRNAYPAFCEEKINAIVQTYIKQAESISTMNQKYIDTLSAQFASTQDAFAPMLTKVAKDVETNLESSRAAMQNTSEQYLKNLNETVKTGKEFLGSLDSQLNSMITSNLKLWSGLFQAAQDTSNGGAKTSSPADKNSATPLVAVSVDEKTKQTEPAKKVSVSK